MNRRPRGCEAAKSRAAVFLRTGPRNWEAEDSSSCDVKALLRSADAELRRAYFAALGYDKVYDFGEVWLAIRSSELARWRVKYGQEWIRTTEGVSQQIYSLPRLATSVPTRDGIRGSPFAVLGLHLSIR